MEVAFEETLYQTLMVLPVGMFCGFDVVKFRPRFACTTGEAGWAGMINSNAPDEPVKRSAGVVSHSKVVPVGPFQVDQHWVPPLKVYAVCKEGTQGVGVLVTVGL
jgi:hypothetical protein